MRVPLEWLKEYVDISLPAEELAEKLTMTGSEVSAIEYHGGDISDVVVGEIKFLKPHPHREKLLVCQVNVGEKEPLQIVTGAKNVKVGDKVPVALHGATLADEIKIRTRELHGVESFGMLCSRKELGVGEEAEGILILPPDTAIGENIKDILGLGGAILEIEVLPNRPDCLSIVGIAREVSAITEKTLKLPKVSVPEAKREISSAVRVEVKDQKLCPRYMARVVEGVKVGESPDWLKNRLLASGLRPINNVVDITNYVLLESGQPLHAFDLKLLEDRKIVVRLTTPKEKIATLDGESRELKESVLCIADDGKPVAIAGVIGGVNSQVRDSTTSVLLESAYFDPASINRTSKALKLRTESSARFESGVDWEGVARALDRAAALTRELAGGEILKGIIDIKEREREPKTVTLHFQKINKLLGTDLQASEIVNILKRLAFIIQEEKETEVKVQIPLFRTGDIEKEVDLIEEIARIHGYGQIPSTLPQIRKAVTEIPREGQILAKIREVMLGCGLTEVHTFSMVGPKSLDKVNLPLDSPLRKTLRIANPLSEEGSQLRTMLLPSLLEVLSYNANRQVEEVKIFELSKIFLPKREKLPQEKLILGGALMVPGIDFYYLKGIIQALLLELDVVDYEIEASKHVSLHPGRSASLIVKNEIGVFGELHPDVQKAYNLPHHTYVFEIEVEPLIECRPLPKKYKALPKFPKVHRDIALWVPQEVSHKAIAEVIKSTGGPLIEDINLFDQYSGQQAPAGFRGLAYAISFRDPKRTLTDPEVNRKHQEIVKALTSKLKVKVRM